MSIPTITFSKSHNVQFYKTSQQRVREYFKENNKSRFANANMVVKTAFMILLYQNRYLLPL